jgi:hypothetical protein
MDPRYTQQTYKIRRKVLKLVGGAFHVYDAAGNVVFYSQQKAFKMREDIRLYSGEDMQEELLRIHARQIIDFAAAYDIIDGQTSEKIGAIKRKGLASIVRDSWILMDPNDNEIGAVKEDSTGLALLRRFLGELAVIIAPQQYHFELGGAAVARGHQNRNPFVYTVTLDFSSDPQFRLDRRLALATALLLAAVEGKQG